MWNVVAAQGSGGWGLLPGVLRNVVGISQAAGAPCWGEAIGGGNAKATSAAKFLLHGKLGAGEW